MDNHETHEDSTFPVLQRMEAAKLAVAMELISELYGMDAAVDVYQRLTDFADVNTPHETVLEEWPELRLYEAAEAAKAAAIKAGTEAAKAQINKHLGGAA
jgi:hypothetical protein